MIYAYKCECGLEKDVVKPASEYNSQENCDRCDRVMNKVLTTFLFHGSKPQHAEFNPAFGKVIKNKRHREYEAQKNGMVEIGNEKTETMCNYFDKQRKDKRNANWKQAIEEVT